MSDAETPSIKSIESAYLKMEAAVVGACLVQDLAPVLVDRLDETKFLTYLHKAIFLAVSELVVDDRPLDLLSVQRKLERGNHVVSLDDLSALKASAPEESVVDEYVEEMVDKFARFRLSSAIKSAETQLKTDYLSASEIADDLQERISHIHESRTGRENSIQSLHGQVRGSGVSALSIKQAA